MEESLYQKRIQKELGITQAEIKERMDWSKPILAQNSKCSVSLDLPLLNCKPSSLCSEVCYAAQGRQNYRRAIIKSLAVNQMILENPQQAALKMVVESGGIPIRLAGSGELLPEHNNLVHYIELYGGTYWGFTRRVDTHQSIPKLMFSFDQSSTEETLEYIRDQVPVNRRAYLRNINDPVAPFKVAVTFPVHGSQTNLKDRIEKDPTDCPAARKYVAGCWACKRCYNSPQI